MDAVSSRSRWPGSPILPLHLPKGTNNLLVPGEHEVYVAPELILHYIADHGYSPPEEFCSALLSCPEIPSMPYFWRLVEAGGDAWQRVIRTERLRQLDMAELGDQWRNE